MLAYSIIFAVALTGLAGLPWWLVAVGAIGLTLVGMSQHASYQSGSSRVTTAEVLAAASLISFFNSLLASGVAYGLGKFTGTVWGI